MLQRKGKWKGSRRHVFRGSATLHGSVGWASSFSCAPPSSVHHQAPVRPCPLPSWGLLPMCCGGAAGLTTSLITKQALRLPCSQFVCPPLPDNCWTPSCLSSHLFLLIPIIFELITSVLLSGKREAIRRELPRLLLWLMDLLCYQVFLPFNFQCINSLFILLFLWILIYITLNLYVIARNSHCAQSLLSNVLELVWIFQLSFGT